MTKTIWGDEWEVTREMRPMRTKDDITWCFVLYGEEKTILVIDRILLQNDLAYLLEKFQTTYSESVLQKETYVPINKMSMDEIDDLMRYTFGA